jgi:diguanylate cyclase
MRSTPGGPQWRGWDETSAGGPGLVTSARLGADAPVQNRMFPKVRSWFALGAPLELLSPLSVARIVLLLLVVGEIVAFAGDRPGAVAALVALTVGVLVVLSRVKELGPRHSIEIAAFMTAVVGVLVWAGDASAMSLLFVMLFVPIGVFAGLFFTWRALLGQHLLVFTVAFVAFFAGGVDWPSAAGMAGLTFVGVTIAAFTVALTSASARRKAMIDSDTGIPNAYGFAETLADALVDGPVVVAAVALGGLDEAREALGHRAGTELLRRAVEDLGQVLPGAASIGRGDGDQLMVAQPADPSGDERTLEQAAADLADHLADGIGSGRYLVDGIEVILRPHVGLAIGPQDGADATELIRRASLTATRAATSGEVHARWDSAMTSAMTGADLALLADLRLASERGELRMAYQPQIDPTTGATVAVEALIRWTSPTHGSVRPDVFIPLAERTGLIDRLTDWVLGEALDAQVRWRRVGLHLPVSVNVSAGSLSDPALPDRLFDALRIRRLPGEVLTVEVTETAALDADVAVDRLRAMHEAGIGVSIDDFGTGYTSLAVLPHLPVDELKVDQRFVIASGTSPADDAIVRSVLELAHQLGLRAVAEGVEDEATWARLREYGFDLLQGWAFSKALFETDLIDFVCRAPHAALQEAVPDPAPQIRASTRQ